MSCFPSSVRVRSEGALGANVESGRKLAPNEQLSLSQVDSLSTINGALVEKKFPFDLFEASLFEERGGLLGSLIARLRDKSMHPPYPWGQWLYARLLNERSCLMGDIVECGVGRGGMSVFLAQCIKGGRQRTVYSIDSFSGLPAPQPGLDNVCFLESDYKGSSGADDLFKRFCNDVASAGLQSIIRPIRGFFETALKELPEDMQVVFAHIDADLYSSVLVALRKLFPSVVGGGVVVIDDFFHQAQGPLRAAATYFGETGYRPLYHISFPYSTVIVKGEPIPQRLCRSIDGNRYTLDFLRGDELLREAIDTSLRHIAPDDERRLTNARLLKRLLDYRRIDDSADIYAYWFALRDYWNWMDNDRPAEREPHRI